MEQHKETKRCPFCNGIGTFPVLYIVDGFECDINEICIHCNGSGEVESDYI